MYYPIGWHKALKLDKIQDDGQHRTILSIQANQERELYFILTDSSIHIWNSRPAIEIVAHKRSLDSIEKIGLNRRAVWRPDSSVIVVVTERDQLLFFRIRKRVSSTSATNFLLNRYSDSDNIYKLRCNAQDFRSKILKQASKATNNSNNYNNSNANANNNYNNNNYCNNNNNDDDSINKDSSNSLNHDAELIPALTIYSFGKLDLSFIGISCLLSAEEELVVAGKNGDIYGIHWTGNVDHKFPWSILEGSTETSTTKNATNATRTSSKTNNDYVVNLKFSSILSGFVLLFNSGRVGFMPLDYKTTQDDSSAQADEFNREGANKKKCKINYLAGVNNAICAEINHKFRLVAIGLTDATIVVCNIVDSSSTWSINHKLELHQDKHPFDSTRLGPIKCMRYSPDSFALVTAWTCGHFAIWSVFGTLLFSTVQWYSESKLDGTLVDPLKVADVSWGREGSSLWMITAVSSSSNSVASDKPSETLSASTSSTTLTGSEIQPQNDTVVSFTTTSSRASHEIIILSLVRSSLPSSPHLTCSSDSIVLIGDERLYIGPSIPHKAEFDNWIVIDVPQTYLRTNFPIRHASVDRQCKHVAIAGNYGFAIYSIETAKWIHFAKRSHLLSFSVCGDIIWWKDYLVLSCYNLNDGVFELRAYLFSGAPLSNAQSVVHTTLLEIIRMSIFENRLLALYSDGTLGMLMLNLRQRPGFKRSKELVVRTQSTSRPGLPGTALRTQRSDSVVSTSTDSSLDSTKNDISLSIAPIENLVISNLQANPHCISSIALTKLHFKNSRTDDSILLNACGKLFLLERELPASLTELGSPLISSNSSSFNNKQRPKSKSKCGSPVNTITEQDNCQREPPANEPLSLPTAISNVCSTATENNMAADLVQSAKTLSNSAHFAAASLRNNPDPSALSNVTFKAVSVIATNVEQFWISPEICNAPEMSYFKKSLWLYCGSGCSAGAGSGSGANSNAKNFQVWLPLLNDKLDLPTDLYVPDRIMLPIRSDIYPLAIRSSSVDVDQPDDAILLGAESDILFGEGHLFAYLPYTSVKRQCRVYLHRILRELLLSQHLGYYARKIAECCQPLPYFAHCFELLLHEVLAEEATKPTPLPDPMLPQVVRFIKEFPVYLDTVVHCARKSELSMWSHLFDERAVGNPRRLFQECLEQGKLDTAASCLIILQSLDRNIVSQRMIRELIRAARDSTGFAYLVEDLEGFLARAELDCGLGSNSASPT